MLSIVFNVLLLVLLFVMICKVSDLQGKLDIMIQNQSAMIEKLCDVNNKQNQNEAEIPNNQESNNDQQNFHFY